MGAKRVSCLSDLSLAFILVQGTSGFPDLINRVLQQVPWWKQPLYPLQAFSAMKVIPSGIISANLFKQSPGLSQIVSAIKV